MAQDRPGEADGAVTYPHVRGRGESGGGVNNEGVVHFVDSYTSTDPNMGRSSDTGLGDPSDWDPPPAELPAALAHKQRSPPPSRPARQPQPQQQPTQRQSAFPPGPSQARPAIRPAAPQVYIPPAADEYSEEGGSERSPSPRSATSPNNGWAAPPVRCQGLRLGTIPCFPAALNQIIALCKRAV